MYALMASVPAAVQVLSAVRIKMLARQEESVTAKTVRAALIMLPMALRVMMATMLLSTMYVMVTEYVQVLAPELIAPQVNAR